MLAAAEGLSSIPEPWHPAENHFLPTSSPCPPSPMEKQTQQDRVSNIVREEFDRKYQGRGLGDAQPTFDGAWPPSERYLAGLAAYANNLDPSLDLSSPSIPYYGTLRVYSLQHMCQELNHLSRKTLDEANASWHDLERMRLLLREQGTRPTPQTGHR